jgi:Sel1 repeat
MIELRKQQAEWAPNRKEALERIERELMELSGKWSSTTLRDIDGIEIAFSFKGFLLDYCDPSHWPPELIANCASADTRWAIKNARLRGESVIQHYIRKWELGWRRFLPWAGKAINNGLGTNWLRKAAELGNVVAQRQLAECYASGDGVGHNDGLAALWCRKAAEQGDQIAQHCFGCYCDQGRGVSQDRAEAAKWYRASAEAGHAPAQYNLGLCYYYGAGVERDYVQAAKWLHKAAEQGLPEAQGNLGLCYLEGHGVPQNYIEAAKYYRKAAEQGYPEAQYNLAACYYDGLGVSPDYLEAFKWVSLIPFGKLCGRLECAQKLRDELAGKLSSEQVAEARRRAASYRQS